MPYKPSDQYVKRFATSNPTTAAAADADALPTATAALAGTGSGAMTLTVSHVSLGLYEITGTIPSTRVKGDVLNVSVAATVAGVAGVGVVDNQVLDSKRTGDLNDVGGVAQTGDSFARLGAPITASVVADIQTRSTYAGGDTAGTTSLLALLTAVRAAKLDNLDALISSRSTYAGADTAGTTSLLALLTAARALKLDFLDAAISSRSTYAGVDTPGTTSLLSLLTSARANKLDFLDALISSRSTYAGADTAGTTTLLNRLTAPRAVNLDFLDVALSSRSTYAGADTAGTTSLLSLLTLARANKLDFLDAAITSRSTYAGADTAGTTTLISILTPSRASKLDNLDVLLSSRSTYAGADTTGTATLLSLLTPARASKIDNLDDLITSRSTYTGADTAGTTALLSLLTSTRATYLDNLAGGLVALKSQIPPQFTPATFNSPGVFSATALEYAPTGSGGGGTAVDQWLTGLPGSYAPGSAGYILGTMTGGGGGGGDTPGTATLLSLLTPARASKLDFLDAAMSSRSTYAGADTPGTTTLVGRITGVRAAYLDNLSGGPVALKSQVPPEFTSVAFSSNGVFSAAALAAAPTGGGGGGADTPGTATLLSLLTPVRANKLDFLDAAITSRSTYTGADTPGTGTILSLFTPIRAGYLDNLSVYPFPAVTVQFGGSAGSALDALATQNGQGVILSAVHNLEDLLPSIDGTGAVVLAAVQPYYTPSGGGGGSGTDGTVTASLTAIQAVTDKLDTTLQGSGPYEFTHTALSEVCNYFLDLPSGVVTSAVSGMIFVATGVSLVPSSGAYNGMIARFKTGVLSGQRRPIKVHSVSNSFHTFTITSPGYSETPAVGDKFDIV